MNPSREAVLSSWRRQFDVFRVPIVASCPFAVLKTPAPRYVATDIWDARQGGRASKCRARGH